MTKLTKNELVTLNAKLAAENEQLRAEVSKLKAQVAAVTSVASAINEVNGPAARKAAMDAAREMAMRFGRVTKVEA